MQLLTHLTRKILITSSALLLLLTSYNSYAACLAIAGSIAGNASISSANEYILTKDLANQNSALWGNEHVNLNLSFDYNADVYLGSRDGGADGMTFTLQNISNTALGQRGRGLGAGDSWSGIANTNYSGITPSLIIELDTFYNNDAGWSDIQNDHLAVYINGNGRHNKTSTDLVSPVSLGNIEDDQYHSFRVVWNAPIQVLQVYFDNKLVANTTIDLVKALGTSKPYWGYTAATGWISNIQKVCNQTNPATPNQPPAITSNGGASTATINLNENITEVTTVIANDPDNDIIAYSINGGTDASQFTIDSITGKLSFITAPNYENPSDSNKDRNYEVIVRAVDNKGGEDSQILTITINDVFELVPQTCGGYHAAIYDPNTTLTNTNYQGWTSPYNVNLIGAFEYNEYAKTVNWMSINTTEWVYAADITDGVGDDASYVGTRLKSADWDHSVEFSRLITAKEEGKYRFYLKYGDDHVKIYVNGALVYQRANAYTTSGEEVLSGYNLKAGDELKIVVIEEDLTNTGLWMNITPLFDNPCNTPPVITSHNSTDNVTLNISEGSTAVTTIAATDIDNDIPTYSISGGADATKFSIDANTGVIKFITAPIYGIANTTNLPQDSNGDNIFEVITQASDGKGGIDTQTLNINLLQGLIDTTIQIKARLQGAYSEKEGLMHETLRVKNLIPINQPFTNLINSTGQETLNKDLLAITGKDAIVDWILVELRSATTPSQIIRSIPCLIKRNGEIIDPITGNITITIKNLSANTSTYHVAVRHRNHLGLITQAPVNLSPTTTTVIDYDKNPKLVGSILSVEGSLMLAGDINNDQTIIANGYGNDSNVILSAILLAPDNITLNTNYILKKYAKADINLDGEVIFAGPNNDLNLVAFNVVFYPENTYMLQNYIISGKIPK
ncbi:MAG: hypothetical protein RLZZ422_2282 [Pseudomonadota bacterium]|jgi:hypothetical protein